MKICIYGLMYAFLGKLGQIQTILRCIMRSAKFEICNQYILEYRQRNSLFHK